MKKLKWYVLVVNPNKDTVENFNIFNSVKFGREVKFLMEDSHYDTKEEFVKALRSSIRYCFWSKFEYEIAVSGLLIHNIEEWDQKAEKIDVAAQVEPNIEILAKYIQDNYEKGMFDSYF